MGRISAAQVAGLDLVDKLFFNQILVYRLFEEEELCWLKDLHDDIEGELTERDIVGVQRQIVKHCVLCLLEAQLSESILLIKESFPDKVPPQPADFAPERFEETERYKLEFFQAVVLVGLSKLHDCDMDLCIDITNKLHTEYAEAPATVRYRLVERMFAFNFIGAPIDCFTWLSQMGVLNSAKHRGLDLKSRYTPEFLQRLALLCEFDMVRDYVRRATELGRSKSSITVAQAQLDEFKELSDQTRDMLVQKMSKAMKVDSMPKLKNSYPVLGLHELEHQASVERFFTSLNSYAIRFRTFQGSLASWTGMLCGGAVEVLHHRQDRKPAIYAGEFNEGSLTDKIHKGMSARGFEITPRAIYDRHRDFKETILRTVGIYYHMQQAQNVAIPPDLCDLTYDAITPHIELLKPTPRRQPRPSL